MFSVVKSYDSPWFACDESCVYRTSLDRHVTYIGEDVHFDGVSVLRMSSLFSVRSEVFLELAKAKEFAEICNREAISSPAIDAAKAALTEAILEEVREKTTVNANASMVAFYKELMAYTEALGDKDMRSAPSLFFALLDDLHRQGELVLVRAAIPNGDVAREKVLLFRAGTTIDIGPEPDLKIQ